MAVPQTADQLTAVIKMMNSMRANKEPEKMHCLAANFNIPEEGEEVTPQQLKKIVLTLNKCVEVCEGNKSISVSRSEGNEMTISVPQA